MCNCTDYGGLCTYVSVCILFHKILMMKRNVEDWQMRWRGDQEDRRVKVVSMTQYANVWVDVAFTWSDCPATVAPTLLGFVLCWSETWGVIKYQIQWHSLILHVSICDALCYAAVFSATSAPTCTILLNLWYGIIIHPSWQFGDYTSTGSFKILHFSNRCVKTHVQF